MSGRQLAQDGPHHPQPSHHQAGDEEHPGGAAGRQFPVLRGPH